MKSLYLLRHAKTEAGGFFTQDKNRELTDQGRADCSLMARQILAKSLVPDQILCSNAERAMMTCGLITEGLGKEPAIEYEDDLYLAEATILMAFAKGAEEIGNSLMLVAHNPGLASLAFAMAGQNSALPPKLAEFPPGSLAAFIFECDHWTDLDPTKARLTHFVTPSALK